jgi:galactoside O-acetyltransferase
MTQYERMMNGLIYNPGDPEIMAKQAPYLDGLAKFNALLHTQAQEKQAYMKRVFAECGDNCYIEPPFHANWGGAHLHFGSGIYANFNLTVVDDGHIYVGNQVMFGPNVTIATAGVKSQLVCKFPR